jgi:hypothetical protein
MVAACFLFARCRIPNSPTFAGSLSPLITTQVDEFVSRLKETKVAHRHFYEVAE